MKPFHPSRAWLGLVGLASCAATPGVDESPSSSAPIAAPMDASGALGSNWEYLLGKYDSNGDARIESVEYGRDVERFERLDLDRDGVLTVEDFPELDPASFRGFYDTQRGLRILGRFFQADENTGELALDEVEWMLSTYDVDGDQVLSAEEFAETSPDFEVEIDDGDESNTQAAMMGAFEPWDILLEAVDEDGDGRARISEVVAFFHLNDDGDRIISLRSERGEGAAPDSSGIPVGEPAFDFTLSSPDGDQEVTLSSFQGSRPVALVFGSYT